MELTSIQLVALMKAAVAPPTRRGAKPVLYSPAGLKKGSEDEFLVEDSQLVELDGQQIAVGPVPDANLEKKALSVGAVLFVVMQISRALPEELNAKKDKDNLNLALKSDWKGDNVGGASSGVKSVATRNTYLKYLARDHLQIIDEVEHRLAEEMESELSELQLEQMRGSFETKAP